MIPLRAKQILEEAQTLSTIGPWSDYLDKVTTPGEKAFIKEVWRLMPGNTCYVDAIHRIVNGTIPMPKDNCNALTALLHAEVSLQNIGSNQYYSAWFPIDCKFIKYREKLCLIIFSSKDQSLYQNRLEARIKQQDKEFLKCVPS